MYRKWKIDWLGILQINFWNWIIKINEYMNIIMKICTINKKLNFIWDYTIRKTTFWVPYINLKILQFFQYSDSIVCMILYFFMLLSFVASSIHLNNFYLNTLPVGVEHLIALLTPQCFQIPLTPRMFPAWDFMVGIFARKALLNVGRVFPTINF